MKQKKQVVIAVIAFSFAAILIPGYFSSAEGNTSSAPAARTGSPGDGLSCTSCHAGTATTVAGLITSDIPAGGYLPGQVYTVTGTISAAGKTKFGFEISPQNISGAQLGTLNVTDPLLTTLVGSGKYITHKTAGTSFPSGTATWSFTWTAPALGTGPVTFYGAFNITNSSNTSGGDVVKLSSLTVQEDPTASIEENEFSSGIQIFPNPAEAMLTVSMKNTENDGTANIDLYGIDGKVLRSFRNSDVSTVLNLEGVNPGFYMLRIENKKGVAIKRFIKK